MPVEIREMVVKAIVPSDDKITEGQADENGRVPVQNSFDQAEIIDACVNAVLRILEKRDRR